MNTQLLHTLLQLDWTGSRVEQANVRPDEPLGDQRVDNHAGIAGHDRNVLAWPQPHALQCASEGQRIAANFRIRALADVIDDGCTVRRHFCCVPRLTSSGEAVAGDALDQLGFPLNAATPDDYARFQRSPQAGGDSVRLRPGGLAQVLKVLQFGSHLLIVLH